MKVAFADGPWPGHGHRTQRWPHKNPGGNINPPPLFQMYAAAVLRTRGHESRLWDAPAQGLETEPLVEQVAAFTPDLIVVNATTPSFDHDRSFLAALRAGLPSARIVAVGPHVTTLASEVLAECPAIDVVALGEYDVTIADLADHPDDPDTVPGLAYRRDGEAVYTEARPPIEDLDSLPFPAWDLVDPGRYRESMFPAKKRPIATVMTSRGCNHRCSFCLYPQVLFPGKLRRRSLGAVLEEMRWLQKGFGAKFFYFEDDNFTFSWRRVEEFCELLLRENMRVGWGCLSRTDGVTPERLELMQRAGCYLIKYGVESGVQGQLDRINKKNTLAEIQQAFDRTRRTKILSHATVMLGVPGDTPDSLRQTLGFVKRIAPDSVQFSVCTPFPGTQFWRDCEENGWLEYDCWEDFDGAAGCAVSYPELPREELRRTVKDAYLSYYSSWPLIRQRIRRMLCGPDQLSQVMRSLWLLRRFFTVMGERWRGHGGLGADSQRSSDPECARSPQ